MCTQYEEIFDAEPQSSAPLRGIANISGGMSLRENSAGPIFISRHNAGGRWISGGRQGGIDERHHIYNLTQPRIAKLGPVYYTKSEESRVGRECVSTCRSR